MSGEAMELLVVDCGNGVERGPGPLNTPRTLCPSSSSVDPRPGATMRGDWWPIVIYVVEGWGVRYVGRWRGEDGSQA